MLVLPLKFVALNSNSQLNRWAYNLRIEDDEDVDGFQTEDNLRLAPSEDEENENQEEEEEEPRFKRKRNSEEVQQKKKEYLPKPITREYQCMICFDPLLGPYNKLEWGKVHNLGLDREVLDDKGNVIGKKIPTLLLLCIVVEMVPKRCIDKQLEPTQISYV